MINEKIACLRENEIRSYLSTIKWRTMQNLEGRQKWQILIKQVCFSQVFLRRTTAEIAIILYLYCFEVVEIRISYSQQVLLSRFINNFNSNKILEAYRSFRHTSQMERFPTIVFSGYLFLLNLPSLLRFSPKLNTIYSD